MKQVYTILDKMVKDEVRRQITEDKVRPDGRKLDEIRPLSSETQLYNVLMVQHYLRVVKRKLFLFVH